jgi:YidC/Oxa1 family membrane protein insertase
VPALGWETTIAFLILPVLLVASQFASMQLMQPKSEDSAAQQSNAILKFLPFMIGWFSLSVPAALTIYWFTNNIVTTATSLIIRNSMKVEPAAVASSTPDVSSEQRTLFSPPPLKPEGFGASQQSRSRSLDGVKPITAIDAEVVDDDDMADGESGVDSKPKSSKKRGKKRN